MAGGTQPVSVHKPQNGKILPKPRRHWSRYTPNKMKERKGNGTNPR